MKNVVINSNGAETTHNKISKTVCNRPKSIGHSKRQNTNTIEIKQTLRSTLQVATKACKKKNHEQYTNIDHHTAKNNIFNNILNLNQNKLKVVLVF